MEIIKKAQTSMNKLALQKEVDLYKKNRLTEKLKADMELNARKVAVMRRIYQEKKEVEVEEALARARESAGWRLEELEQEERLAYEIDKAKNEELKQKRIRQLIYSSREISDLTDNLKRSYHQKELAFHRANKEKDSLQTKYEDKMYYEALTNEQQLRELCEKREKEKAERIKKSYKECLQDQMIDNHKLKIVAYRKSLEETALANDAVRIAMLEDEKEEEEKLRYKECLRNEIEVFKQAKQFWMQNEKKILQKEDEKIERYLDERNERERRLQQENLRKENLKMQGKSIVVDRIHKLEKAKEEREHIAEVLLGEETRIKEEIEQRALQEKIARTQKESREVFKAQLAMKYAQKEEEKKRDREYALLVKREAELERQRDIDWQTKQKQMRLQYGEDLRKNVLDAQRQKFEDLLLSIKEEEGMRAERDTWSKQLDEERRRLLNEHVPNLIGFLPPGIIRDTDLPHLNAEVHGLLSKQRPKPYDQMARYSC